MEKRRSSRRQNRRGASAVEFAMVAPVLLIFVFGIIECSRLFMVKHEVLNASRRGARMAVLDGETIETVRDAVEDDLNDAGITVDRNDIIVSPDPNTAANGTAISVTVSVPAADVSWLPGNVLLDNLAIDGSTTMRRENGQ